jgi:hypothetical protein
MKYQIENPIKIRLKSLEKITILSVYFTRGAIHGEVVFLSYPSSLSAQLCFVLLAFSMRFCRDFDL